MWEYCQECGEELIPNTEYCRKCGAPIPKDKITDNILSNKNFKYGLLIIVAIAILLMVSFTVAGIVNSDSDSNVALTNNTTGTSNVDNAVDTSSNSSVEDNSTESETSNLEVNDLSGTRSVDALEDHLYGVKGELVADKDYEYLEMTVVYYDEDGTMLDQDQYAWSQSGINQGDSVEISCESLVSSGKAYSAKVYIFDEVSDGDLSKAIWSGDCEIPKDYETPGANTGNLF